MSVHDKKKVQGLRDLLNRLQDKGLHVNWGGTDAHPYLRVDLGDAEGFASFQPFYTNGQGYSLSFYEWGAFDRGESAVQNQLELDLQGAFQALELLTLF